MSQNKKRPQYIENQLKNINDALRSSRVKWDDHYTNPLFQWFTTYLLHHGWYRGFNTHYDVTTENGRVIRALTGPDYENYDYYIQIW